MNEENEFKQLLRERRIGKNYTQAKLAEKCNLSARQISNIETGKTNPKLDTAVKLCEACEINIGELKHFNWKGSNEDHI